MRVLLVNQFVPPDDAPTARLLGDLARGLEAAGWEVSFLGGNRGYRGKPVAGWRRWWRDLRTHARLLAGGLTRLRPDFIVCLSDPPALVFTMAIVAGLRSATLIYWPMDVYPRIAAALGEISGESLVYRLVQGATAWGESRCSRIVPLDEDMRREFCGSVHPDTPAIAPWPPAIPVPERTGARPGGRVCWTYSGNLGRAHDYETLLRAQRILEDRGAPFDLVFQGGGAARESARRMAADLGLRHCAWRDYVDESRLVDSLLEANLLIVTQRVETRGLLWPSKLALIEVLPRPVAWVGPTDGATAARLRASGRLAGIFNPGDSAGLAGWLLEHLGELQQVPSLPFVAEAAKKSLDNARETGIKCWNDVLAAAAPARPRQRAA